jgi:hypothetical protein
MYGLDHTMQRFQPEIASELRPKTDIPGLYLTGIYAEFYLNPIEDQYYLRIRVRVMVFNATCNNISVISWRSVFLVE